MQLLNNYKATNANIKVVKVYLLYLNYKLIIFVDLSFSKLLF